MEHWKSGIVEGIIALRARRRSVVTDDSGNTIAFVLGDDYVTHAARIAAAPDLLEVCEELLCWLDCVGSTPAKRGAKCETRNRGHRLCPRGHPQGQGGLNGRVEAVYTRQLPWWGFNVP
jgi:hypothetical protein